MTARMTTISNMLTEIGAGNGIRAHTPNIMMPITKYLDKREDSG